jgi:hypothetical protein
MVIGGGANGVVLCTLVGLGVTPFFFSSISGSSAFSSSES